MSHQTTDRVVVVGHEDPRRFGWIGWLGIAHRHRALVMPSCVPCAGMSVLSLADPVLATLLVEVGTFGPEGLRGRALAVAVGRDRLDHDLALELVEEVAQ